MSRVLHLRCMGCGAWATPEQQCHTCGDVFYLWLADCGDSRRWPDLVARTPGRYADAATICWIAGVHDEDLIMVVTKTARSLGNTTAPVFFYDYDNEAIFANVLDAAIDEQDRRNGRSIPFQR